ncbi:MAG: SigB/SigF/SigG family RNA polymerase sigma factor [Clostridiales bacterium]|nr:SigB/SigF/SigG family RNA polymerase sigma factor [Clostridiales bacterium]
MDRTLALIQRAHQGDKSARDTLFEENTGLIYSVAKRFAGRGTEMEDLFQIGSIGLLKAADRFDPEFEVKFSTYAVPMIAGEIRRFLRDDGMIRVSRALKELSRKILCARESLTGRLGREPTLEELCEETGAKKEEIVEAMEAGREVESLYRPVCGEDDCDVKLLDRIEEKRQPEEEILDRLILKQLLEELSASERRLIGLRYFAGQTQAEVGKTMGISQVQVSRTEKRILKKLRKDAGISPSVKG